MKILLVNLFLVLGMTLSAQSEIKFLEALGANKMEVLESHMASKINLCINDNTNVVSRSSALASIRKFYANNSVTKFKLLHKGKSSDKTSSYKVARLKTNNGNFRVFAYSELVNGKSKVVEIRINAM